MEYFLKRFLSPYTVDIAINCSFSSLLCVYVCILQKLEVTPRHWQFINTHWLLRRRIKRTLHGLRGYSAASLSAEARDRFETTLCKICGILRDSDVGFLRLRRLSTVRIIPPVLHTLSFITDPIEFEQLSAWRNNGIQKNKDIGFKNSVNFGIRSLRCYTLIQLKLIFNREVI